MTAKKSPPKIFVSGTRNDLESCHLIVRNALLAHGWEPVEEVASQETEASARLREKIAGCEAVVYLVGECYGPDAPGPQGFLNSSRSFAQFEFEIAWELDKPTCIFVFSDDFPFDNHEPEPPEHRALQKIHRAALRSADKPCVDVKDKSQLADALELLLPRAESVHPSASIKLVGGQILVVDPPPKKLRGCPKPRLEEKPGSVYAQTTSEPPPAAFYENIQFTAYRPRVIAPGKWKKMLVFEHLDDRPDWLDDDELGPIEAMQSEAERILGPQTEEYRSSTDDSRLAVPRDGEITLVPQMGDVEFNPPRRTFLWKDGITVHQASFDLRASGALNGQVARGRMTIFSGHLILAEISLSIHVDSSKASAHRTSSWATKGGSAKPYRRIFASYSHRDLVIVETMQRHARILGDEYLRDWESLRSGEIWNERLQDMVRAADVFQLFWSSNSAKSKFVESEWRYALNLKRPLFVRPTYWEEPMPTPPEPLRGIHFQRLITERPTVLPSDYSNAPDAAPHAAENIIQVEREPAIQFMPSSRSTDSERRFMPSPAPATEIEDQANQVKDLQEAKALTPIRRSRISALASAVKTVGTWLLGAAFFAVIILALATGGQVASWVQPWVQVFSGMTLLILLPISLVLLVSRHSRGYGGLGIYFTSWPVGLSLWLNCFVYALNVSVVWTVVGILLGGLGVVPIAAVMTLIRTDWSSFGSIIGTALVVIVLRLCGSGIVDKSEEWNAAATSRAEAGRERVVKRGNYFVRHWRGQLSLGVSYWVNGFVGTLLVALSAVAIAEIHTDLKTLAALSLLVLALSVIASVWQGVGVWRSASNHFSRGGSHFWAGVARVMVVVGLISTCGVVWRTSLPQAAEMVRILTGDAGLPSYQIQVLPGGTDIEFRGGLRAGSARELERIFSAVPRAKVLHIESPGGRIAEAKQMMQLVRQRNLATYTSEYCLSAATLVLMAGKERVIAADAKVGFHAGSFPGLTAEQQRDADDLVRSTMRSAGVSQGFIDRVVATPADKMWYPSFEEMRTNGVATSQSYGERFAVSWAQSDIDIEAVVKKVGDQPWFRTVRELEPKLYAKMIDEFTTAIKSGKSEGEAISVAQAPAVAVMEKYFPAASDQALLALLQDQWIAMLTKYKHRNSRACIAVLGGFSDTKINFARAFPDWDASITLLIADGVMRSGASKIPVAIDQEAASRDLQRVRASLAATYGNDFQLLDNESEWMGNSQKVCEMLLAMYQQIAALPSRRAANLMRYLLTVNSTVEDQPAPSASPFPSAPVYRVVNIRPGDVLNLRTGPGSNYPVVAIVRSGARGITLGKGRVANGITMWQEISVNGYSGWVNAEYLAPETPQ